MVTTPAAPDRFSIRLEFTYHAPVSRIWKALTEELNAWWGPPYLLLDAEVTDLVLEPKLGGLMYEKWSGTDGGIWGQVTSIKSEHWIELRGQMGLSGPAVAIVCYELEPTDTGTLLKFSHVASGQVDAKSGEAFTKGWQDLLGDRLRAWVHDGIAKGIHASIPAATKA